ncbi:SusC/RagA family TonB-linked outer membrane protein [Flavobacterium sp. ACAM 123]|jgi:TonB-linked SusC/RagA family outer membrane protein|uniref:SusC/RagA family TonB-linked outer membrane protein n=1 Tax=Flavobacterium sp. ACAM 123 TaxID=1189620 RepID=UPI00049788CE|nr:SusC/RagA family TonB-linked outer membrane protein [Flavobacterium sp. ACAM 123]
MKNSLTKGLIMFLTILCTSLTYSQQVTGTVSDSNGPLPGASVLVKGTTNGAQTDPDGKFTIKITGSNAVLIFTYIGLETQEVNTAGKNVINVTLKSDSAELQEVVVVGYGVKKKSLVTGSISSISSKQIESSSNARVEQVLQGRTSGVTVVSSSGSPGSGAKVRIRGAGSNGNSDPLYIVDGMKVSTIENLAPSDIANVEVLKDAASAAIYGTEGANGVVIITTKQGKVGDIVVSYNSQFTTQSVRTKMELMDASQFVTYFNEAGNAAIVDNGINTNWIDETFQNAFAQRHDLSISGASERTNYYLSGTFLNQEGIIGGADSAYKRYTLRTNIKSQVKDWLEVGANISYSNTGSSPISEDDSTGGVVNHLLIIDPLTPVFYNGALPQRAIDGVTAGTAMVDSNGNVYGYPTYSNGEVMNPVAETNYRFRGNIDTDRMLSTVYAKLTLAEGLSVTSRLGYERSNSIDSRWNPIYYITSEAQNSSVTLRNNISRNSRWLWENFASYTKDVGKHNFTGLLGYSAEKRKNPYYSLKGSEVPLQSEEFAYFDFTNRDNDVIGGNIYQKNMNSVFGRLSYDYNGKYLLEGSIRYDESSVFPKSQKGGYFPAVSTGWVISKEDFWNTDSKISYLKLRGSWGQNGSDANLAGNGDIQVYKTVDGAASVVYEGVSGVTPGDLANPKLTWERSEQIDLGVDLTAFNGKLNFTADYYKKTTRDLIIPDGNIIAPPSLGQTVGAINGGTVENKGLEFEVGYSDKTQGGLQYGINLNLSTLKNKVTEIIVPAALVGAGAPQNNDGVTRFEQGFPLWYFYGYKTDGIDPATGKVIKVDTDGVPGITSNDKTIIGSPQPNLLFGGSFNMSYKGFDFNLMFQGTQGNEIFAAYHQPSRPITNKPVEFFNDRWVSGRTDAKYPGAANVIESYDTDLMVQDGSYLRIKQIQVGYNFSKDLVQTLKLRKLRLYLSLDDYFTFTKYRGLDPESGSFADNSIGVDRGFYPIPAKALLGLSLEF